ncbi:MAG: hypothetical protein HY898_16340 [Deltaproteobacteria bacterium]|nr:hypothetical protein [Deltaproteobacteria bacterium]
MTSRCLLALALVCLGACATGAPSEDSFIPDVGASGGEAGSPDIGGAAGEGGSPLDAASGAGGSAGKAGSAGAGGSAGSSGTGGVAGSAGTSGTAGNGGASGLDASVEADAPVDVALDVPIEVAPEAAPSCKGVLVGGFCWYLGVSEAQHCGLVCGSHGGYNDGTRTFAGSSGTDANCQAVLDALNAPGGTVSTLVGSGSGVGCFFMTMASDRYRVADEPTTSNATYTLAQRACACNQ